MKQESDSTYIGNELDTFYHAVNWKRYFARHVKPHLGESVLEVGAGIGGTAPFLVHAGVRYWTFLEPDPAFCRQIESQLDTDGFQAESRVVNGTLEALDPGDRFDAILYMDVLEHIQHDREELEMAQRYLQPGGRIVVLSPAHQSLFSEFDRAIGHFRRYDFRSLRDLCPPGMSVRRCRYLDSVGMIASFANHALLKQDAPGLKQVLFWDKAMVPISRILDPALLYRLGKSILIVYQKD